MYTIVDTCSIKQADGQWALGVAYLANDSGQLYAREWTNFSAKFQLVSRPRLVAMCTALTRYGPEMIFCTLERDHSGDHKFIPPDRCRQ